MFTTQNRPLPYIEPFVQDYLSRAQDIANVPYSASPSRVAQPNAAQQMGWNAIQGRAMQGSPQLSQARGQLSNTINGGFLPRTAATNQQAGASNPYAALNNPYLQGSIDNAQQDVIRNYNNVARPSFATAGARSGSFGNAGLAQVEAESDRNLQQNLGRIATDARMGAYNQQAGLAENQTQRLFGAGESFAGRQDSITGQERGYQNAAISQAPAFAQADYYDADRLAGVGREQYAQDQAQAGQNYDWWNEAQQYPQQRLGTLGGALGIGVNSGSQQTQPGPSRAGGIIGGALAGSTLGGMYQGQGGENAEYARLIGGLLGAYGGGYR